MQQCWREWAEIRFHSLAVLSSFRYALSQPLPLILSLLALTCLACSLSLAPLHNTTLYYSKVVIRRNSVVPPLDFEGGLG